MSAMSAWAFICFTYIVEKMIPDYRLQLADPRSAYCSETYFKKEPLNHWKIKSFMYLPWVGLDSEKNMLKLKAFAFWIYTKDVGAQRDEKDKCYIQKEWQPINRKIFANYRTFENLETFLFEKGITE